MGLILRGCALWLAERTYLPMELRALPGTRLSVSRYHAIRTARIEGVSTGAELW